MAEQVHRGSCKSFHKIANYRACFFFLPVMGIFGFTSTSMFYLGNLRRNQIFKLEDGSRVNTHCPQSPCHFHDMAEQAAVHRYTQEARRILSPLKQKNTSLRLTLRWPAEQLITSFEFRLQQETHDHLKAIFRLESNFFNISNLFWLRLCRSSPVLQSTKKLIYL